MQKAVAKECEALGKQNGEWSTSFEELSTYADTLESQLHAAGLLTEGGVADPAPEAADTAATPEAADAAAPMWQGVILDCNPLDDLLVFMWGTRDRETEDP